MTTYTYVTTITVRVHMADAGEESSVDGCAQTAWAEGEQEESAREWAEQAMPLTETYAESFVEINIPPLRLVVERP